jgi:hypothetical protein
LDADRDMLTKQDGAQRNEALIVGSISCGDRTAAKFIIDPDADNAVF